MEDGFKVGIVGAGPTGLVLGVELGLRGIPAILFDSRTETTRYPKGGTNSARSMEHYRRYGIAAKLRDAGLPGDHPTDIGYFTRLAGIELARVRLPSRNAGLATGMAETPEPPHRASQMYLEPLLLEKLRLLPSVTLAFGHEVKQLAEQPDGVILEVANCATQQRTSYKVDYAVGCDGANSLVREAMNVVYDGEAGKVRKFMGGKMMAIYFESQELQEILSKRLCWQYWTVNDERRCVMSAVDGTRKFFMHVQIPQDAVPDEQAARAFVRQAIGRDVALDLISISFWVAGRALTAERLCKGRLFVVGDAAHIFTPTGGFGLNTGVDDAANLGWKLAARLQGWGGDALIESYQTERHAVAVRNTQAALTIANRVGACPVSEAIEAPAPEGEAARKAAADYLAQYAFMEFETLGVQLGASYAGSGVVIGDGSTALRDDPNIYTPSSQPGRRLPHLWLASNRSVLDAIGPGLTLLAINTTVDGTDWRKTAEQIGAPFDIVDVRGPEAAKLYGCALLLVRPDQHIAWRGDTPPVDIESILRTVLGMPGSGNVSRTTSQKEPAATREDPIHA